MLHMAILNLACSQGVRDGALMAWLLFRRRNACACHAVATAVRRAGDFQDLQKRMQKALRRA